MAQEEIKLIGSFKDGITPKLQKLTRQIDAIGRSFSKFNRGLRPISREFGRMAASAERFNTAMRSQSNAMRMSSRAMGEYHKQSRKVAASMRLMSAQRDKAMRAEGVTRSQAKSGKGGGGSYVPGGGGSKSAGAGFGKSAGASFTSSVGATAIGTSIGFMASQAIMSGVRGIGGLLKKPFDEFGKALRERVSDEMDDIKSAGGMFALDMDLTQASGNKRLFNNFNEALRFQEDINTRMAQSASNLPGTTSEFVTMNRRLTDTVQMVMENNRDAFVKFGEEQGADVSAGGTTAAKEAMAQVGQNLTESLMLASAGQKGGLPMDLAIQQIVNKEKGKFKAQAFTNKFRAAFQKNPLLKNFLMRAEADINKFEAGSVEKLATVMDVFVRALPQEQINKMRGSLAGLMESVRSGLLDPQGGLFGLSRAVSEFDADGNVIGKLMKKNVNDAGETLYKVSENLVVNGKPLMLAGKEVEKGAELTAAQIKEIGGGLQLVGDQLTIGNKNVGSVSKSTTYLFEQIREIGANYGAILTQFVGLLPTIFDPFAKMTKALVPLRDTSTEFFRVFQSVNKNLYDQVDFMKKTGDAATKGDATNLNKQVMQRGALFAVADALQSFGMMDATEAKKIKDQLVGEASRSKEAVDTFDKTAAAVFKQMFSRILESPIVVNIAEVFGTLFGGIIRTTFDVISGLMGNIVKGGPMDAVMKGFMKGFGEQFKDLGGFSGFMNEVNKLLMQVVDEAATFFVTKVIPALFSSFMQFVMAGFGAGPAGALISGGILVAMAGGLVAATKSLWSLALSAEASAASLSGGLSSIFGRGKGRAKRRGAIALGGKSFAKGGLVGALKATFPTLIGGFGKLSKLLGPVAKIFGKFAGPLAGVVSTISALSSGKGIFESFSIGGGSAIGGGIGAALGSFLGPIGTIVGGLIGAWLGEMFGDWFSKLDFAGMWSYVSAPFQDVINNMMTFIGNEVEKFMGDPATYLGVAVGKFVHFFIFGIPEMLNNAIDFLIEQLGSILGQIPTVVGSVMDQITSAIGSFVEGVKSAISDFISNIKGLPSMLSGGLDGVTAAITNWIGGMANAVKDAISKFASGALSVFNQNPKGNASSSYNGNTSRTMGLGDAISTEMKNKPAGSHLVIANSSETVIPAFRGHMGDSKPFSDFNPMELESVAGYNRMKPYTEQVMELAQKTAAQFGGFAGALGGGSATLNAMEALGHANGLVTTSGNRPGDPGFHGVNRARDLSNGGGETPEMNKVANIMASQFGSSLTELIYTPMGFSIKNGQKTGLISPDNHYHHIHVAVAEGLAKAAVFNSQQAAEQYERRMMPSGAEPMKVNLASMTANSSEFGGGGVTTGDINISVSGVNDPKAIANTVAEEILSAIEKSTYSEVFTS